MLGFATEAAQLRQEIAEVQKELLKFNIQLAPLEEVKDERCITMTELPKLIMSMPKAQIQLLCTDASTCMTHV